MMSNVRKTFACFECFRRSAPLIRRALRTGPVGETLSPSAAAQISSSLLLSSTACQGEGASVPVAGVCVQGWGSKDARVILGSAPTGHVRGSSIRGSGP